MSTQPLPPAHRWPRLRRISMRALIILVLILGGSFGWLMRSVRIQREAVLAIERGGGSVRYDSGWTANRSRVTRDPWAPDWLVRRLGIDYFAHVSRVDFTGHFSDQSLAPLAGLTRPFSLEIDATNIERILTPPGTPSRPTFPPELKSAPVTDAGLSHLKGMTNSAELVLLCPYSQVSDIGLSYLPRSTSIRSLDLTSTNVTDAGLVHLKDRTSLTELQLGNDLFRPRPMLHIRAPRPTGRSNHLRPARITDAGLAHLKGLTNLHILTLQNTRVTDAGLAHLEELTKLQGLHLAQTQITSAGLAHLQHMTSLTWLVLDETAISDAGLEYLGGLKELNYLSLFNTDVTDAGLPHLAKLSKLEYLQVARTQITDAGLKELKKSVPHLFIKPW
jgi:internalin A